MFLHHFRSLNWILPPLAPVVCLNQNIKSGLLFRCFFFFFLITLYIVGHFKSRICIAIGCHGIIVHKTEKSCRPFLTPLIPVESRMYHMCVTHQNRGRRTLYMVQWVVRLGLLEATDRQNVNKFSVQAV